MVADSPPGHGYVNKPARTTHTTSIPMPKYKAFLPWYLHLLQQQWSSLMLPSLLLTVMTLLMFILDWVVTRMKTLFTSSLWMQCNWCWAPFWTPWELWTVLRHCQCHCLWPIQDEPTALCVKISIILLTVQWSVMLIFCVSTTSSTSSCRTTTPVPWYLVVAERLESIFWTLMSLIVSWRRTMTETLTIFRTSALKSARVSLPKMHCSQAQKLWDKLGTTTW